MKRTGYAKWIKINKSELPTVCNGASNLSCAQDEMCVTIPVVIVYAEVPVLKIVADMMYPLMFCDCLQCFRELRSYCSGSYSYYKRKVMEARTNPRENQE